MSEFVGRTGAMRVYSYPETPRAAAIAAGIFARNFATGPKPDFDVPDGGGTLPWNVVDVNKPSSFTITAGDVTVHIPGDVTGAFAQGDTVVITPTVPVSPFTTGVIASAPAFTAGETTFDLSAPIDGSTTAGTIFSTSDVPITPKSTGSVLVEGVITVNNPTGAPIDVGINVLFNEANVANSSTTTVPAGGITSVPFIAEMVGLTVGTIYNFQVFVSGNGIVADLNGSAISVQEVPVSSG